jgi:Fic-DOC domain mobile mystery protein B
MTPFTVPPGGTPIDDAEGLRVPGVTTYEQLSDLEAENIMQAMGRHMKAKKPPTAQWLTEPYIRKVHRDMFSNVWTWAGEYRNSVLNLGVAPFKIREELGKLTEDVVFWETPAAKMPALERGVRLHHRLVWIHPFKNGNGRHARLISNIYLTSQNQQIPTWRQEDLARPGEAREAYLHAIQRADQGHVEPLVQFTMRYIR